jgi:hypothetical protein
VYWCVQVKDRDVNHRAQVGAACEGLDPTRLKLNTTTGLIAPVVVLSHDRPGYLGRTLMTLLKCVQGVRSFHLDVLYDGMAAAHVLSDQGQVPGDRGHA